MVLAEKP